MTLPAVHDLPGILDYPLPNDRPLIDQVEPVAELNYQLASSGETEGNTFSVLQYIVKTFGLIRDCQFAVLDRSPFFLLGLTMVQLPELLSRPIQQTS